MDGSHKCTVEFKKPDTKTYIPHDATYTQKKEKVKSKVCFQSSESW